MIAETLSILSFIISLKFHLYIKNKYLIFNYYNDHDFTKRQIFK